MRRSGLQARGGLSLRARRRLSAYGFIAPSVIILGVFLAWPMIWSLRTSFYDASQFAPPTFVGLGNYRKLLTDATFRGDLVNTLEYAAVVTPISVGLALAFALMLNRRLRGRSFFRASIFLPAVLSLGVMGIAWDFVLDPNIGLLPRWLQHAGLSLGNGVHDPNWAMAYVMFVGIWKNTGFYMVMYLAGLGTIPTDFYEAAAIDGAGPWARFRNITWPLLSNTTLFVFVIAAIASLQAFDQIFVMTRGGPFFKTETLVYLIYRKGFTDFDFGYASAAAWVLVVLVFAISLVQNFYFSRRQVKY
ncbi:carbohydrate ABC transporter permease [Actinoallomurus soli]|uniref:carbohydrate ABC transporter permease n=1 Tax=Actinoallomurus soli TaxID=2952535 RepID=UPI0020936E81|nr:sugar ABC transporter permease [Actinoallomurus soli]MCO5973506.1 sugar ABC transporter permease [Actinoallomurus soli]